MKIFRRANTENGEPLSNQPGEFELVEQIQIPSDYEIEQWAKAESMTPIGGYNGNAMRYRIDGAKWMLRRLQYGCEIKPT